MIHVGDCLLVMPTMEANSIDSIVSDPPYGLGFMGKDWDHGVPGEHFWREALRVAKPGAHLVAFGGTRTFHRLVSAIEDAGWEIRDTLMWVYGSGFPKSLDVSKAIDKHGGQSVAWFGPWFREWRTSRGITQKQVATLFPSASGGLTGCVANWELGLNMPTPEQFNRIRDTFSLPFPSLAAAEREVIGQRRTGIGTGGGTPPIMGDGNRDVTAPGSDAARQWQGWGTALKPAWEPIILARKPLQGTVAANVLRFGTGAVNIDGCRVLVEGEERAPITGRGGIPARNDENEAREPGVIAQPHSLGRWPANVVHDSSDEVVALFPSEAGGGYGVRGSGPTDGRSSFALPGQGQTVGFGDAGSAARFFYTAKAGREDRNWGCDEFAEKPLNWSSGTQNPGSFQAEGTKREARNNHPTVKPHDLMRWLCRLVTPPQGLVLDPFCGSGSTGRAALAEGFRFVGIELDPEYAAIAEARIRATQPGLPFGNAA